MQRTLAVDWAFFHPHFRGRIQDALDALMGGPGVLAYDGAAVTIATGAPVVVAPPPSRDLVTRLINSARAVRIRRTDGENRAEPLGANAAAAMNAASNGTGTDVDVFIKQPTMLPGATGTQATVQGPTGPTLAATPAHILLGHELVHADRMTRGVAAFSQQVGPNGTVWTTTLGSYVRPNGSNSALPTEEIYTIGLPVGGTTVANPDPLAITENALRGEHRLANRVAYP